MNTLILMGVGMRIRKIRRDKELSQEYVAEKVGITPAYVSRIENEKNDPDTELLRKFANALSVNPAEFFEDENTPTSGNLIKEQSNLYFSMPGHISAEERKRIQELVTKLEKIKADDRDLVFEVLDSIFKRTKEK